MLQSIRVLIISIMVSGFMFADVFMTELTDPQNSSDAGRYVELYNNGDSNVDLSTWSVQRWTNGNADPTSSSVISLDGYVINAGEFFIICNDDAKFTATYGMDCHMNISTGGFADSNGDDNMALLNNGEIVDMFGVAGEDGTGTWHEFEDGRAERTADSVSGCTVDCSGWWNIDNDSGGGDGPQYAPLDFDPMAWIGADSSGGDDCASGVYDCAGVCDGSSVEDCFGACDGSGISEGVDCDGAYIVELTAVDFTPENLSISLGETVKWVWVAGYHNVNGSLDDYPNNPEGFESEFGSAGFTYSYTFNVAGAYDYHCDPHLGMGMVGTVSVVDNTPSNLFFSEASEGSSNNKYLEIYNGSDDVVDLSAYSLSSCSNGCDAVGEWDFSDNVTFEEIWLEAGQVYVVCDEDSDPIILTECDQTFSYLSNGDDVFALTQVGTGTVLDVIGLVGDDPGSGWDVAGVAAATKDHTLVRKASVMMGNPLWLDNPETGEAGSAGTNEDDSEWIVFDQNTWDYVGFHPHDFSSDVMGCMDETACNYDADATVDDGSCASLDCAGECGGAAVCEVAVIFSVDMSIEGVTGDVSVRTSTENGEYMPSDWFVMDDSDGDMVYTYTMMLETGVEYGYNFNNGGYESSSGLTGCAGGTFGNDRYLTPGDVDMTLDTVCFGSCEACPAIVEGCMDSTATNFNADATVDDGSCEYETVEYANLFISEVAEGSSNHKYIEIYNASEDVIDLSGYALANTANAPTTPGVYEYWTPFDGLDQSDNLPVSGTTLLNPGDVYTVCDNDLDASVIAECDQYHAYLSNGDDGFCLVGGSEGSFEVLDCVGDWNADPGSGWDVAGVSAATKDHTLVRKASVTTGNDGLWEFSAGEDEEDSEWVVLDQNDWTYIGSHPHSFESADVEGCMDMNALNYTADATVQSYDDNDTSTCTYANCADIPTATGCLWDTGQSSEWWDGWWNCTNGGGQVCGLAEVVFELNLPDTDDLQGNPHVNGSYNDWCGDCYNAMQSVDGVWTHVQYFSEGETHDYKFTMDGWSDQEDLTGLEDCAVETDGYWNRQFTAGAPNTSQTLTNCWGTCEEECAAAPSCGDGVCDESENCGSCASDCGECPPEYAVVFDIDGAEDCGFVSVTGTFDGWSGWGAHTDNGMTANMIAGDYEFVILCVDTQSNAEWYNDIWNSSTVFNAPAECDVTAEWGNYGFTVADMDMTVSICAGTCDAVCSEEPQCSYNGDANGDGTVNVTDIVLIVGTIVGPDSTDGLLCSSDVNEDGLLNVTDIVWLVGTIINGSASSSNSFIATDAVINIASNKLSIDGINGDISGVQLLLSHGSDFNIILENTNEGNLEFSGKKEINKNTTEFFIVKDNLNAIGTTVGDYSILSAIVVTGKGQNTQEIASTVVDLPESFELKSAYPNPFNPITTLELAIPETGYISVKVYNLVGQEIATLVNSVVNATDSYTFQWNANNVSSGIYLVRAEGFGSIQTQKLMLLK